MTLDSLPRKDMLNVINELNDYIGLANAAKSKANEIDNNNRQKYQKLESDHKFKKIVLGIILLMLFSPTFFITIALTFFLKLEIDSYLIFCIAVLIYLLIITIPITIFRSNFNKKRQKYDEFCSGTYAYITAYNNVANSYTEKAYSLQRRYNIHNDLMNARAVGYISNVLTSYSKISLSQAISDFKQLVHNETMERIASEQTRKLKEISAQNERYYNDSLAKLEEIRSIEQKKLEIASNIYHGY